MSGTGSTRAADFGKIPTPFGVLLAAIAGLCLAIQGRINGALGTVLNDGLAAAAVSFATGTALLLLYTCFSPTGRRSFDQVIPALKAQKFPRGYLAAGVVGSFVVFSQSAVVGTIGIALFTVALVTGQSIAGLIVDRIGISPVGKQAITAPRVISVLLVIIAVLWAVSPRLNTAGSGWAILPVLLPLIGGFLISFQQAMNGTQTKYYGSPLPTTVFNFASGLCALLALWLVKLLLVGPPNPPPTEGWYYLGGLLGCIFIALTAWLVKGMGVLLTGLGVIAGQLFGSLALDLLVPAPGTTVTVATWCGTILAFVAIALAAIPWKKRVER